jgi:AbiV family abortive infection protein
MPVNTSRKPPFNRALFSELVRGGHMIFENAEALYREARVLGEAGSVSRALFLHQISLEECAKIESVGPWATSLLAGLPVDGKKVAVGLTRHANKNRTNAYMLDASAEEMAARQRGDLKAAVGAFKKLQAEFHERSNDAKNASLYVDFEEGKFVPPVERITKDMLTEIAARNEEFLGHASLKVRMLSQWDKEPEKAQERAVAFIELAGTLRDVNLNDAMDAIGKLIEKFADAELARRPLDQAKS